MITVALPVYNSKDIAWLCMDSLMMQDTDVPWELIVYEEKHEQQLGEKFFNSYKLKSCKRIVYLTGNKKVSLSKKWRAIALKASRKSKMMCLCAADNYYHPWMIQDVWDAYQRGTDWFYTTKGYVFNFETESVSVYDRPDADIGLQMALSTELARKIPDEDKSRYIDTWIVRMTEPMRMEADDSDHWRETLWTHGMNNISKKRGDMLNPPQPPFYPTGVSLIEVVSAQTAHRLIALSQERYPVVFEQGLDVVNVLTRTYRRPRSFSVCRGSVRSQTYPNVRHIVGGEDDCDYYPCIKLKKKEGENLPWNLHLNDLGYEVKEGWVMYLDDDDMFTRPTAVQEIIDEIDHESQMLIWRTRTKKGVVPDNQHFGIDIVRGQVSGIGFAFHSKHLPVPWEDRHGGDYRVITYLQEFLDVKWVDRVLTQPQNGRNSRGIAPKKEMEEYNLISMPHLFDMHHNEKPKVSVIIPFKDDGYILPAVIRKLTKGISDRDVEVIIVDDGSSEPVPAAITNIFANLRVIRNGNNMGVGYSFDKGALQARGDVFLLMGSDVLMQGRSWLKTALSMAESNHSGITCSVCKGVHLDEYNEIVKRGISRYAADLLFRVDKDDLPIGSLKRNSVSFADILQSKWTDGIKSDVTYDVPSILGAAYVTTREWYMKIGGWGWIKRLDGISGEESKWAGHRRWGGLEPMISLKTWLAGGRCQINPEWTTYHVFDRHDHVIKTRGAQEDRYYFNKLFIAHTLFEAKQAKILDSHLLNKKNENIARHIVKKNKGGILLERAWMDKIQVRDYTFFEDKFGYDLGWLK